MTNLTLRTPALLGRGPFEDLFDNFFQNPSPLIKRSTEGYPLTDLYLDNDGNQVIELALAGFSKEELAVEVLDNKITISANAKEHSEAKEGHQRRIAQRAFSKTFVDYKNQLDFAQSDVSYKDGLLRVVIPKIPEKQSLMLQIQ